MGEEHDDGVAHQLAGGQLHHGQHGEEIHCAAQNHDHKRHGHAHKQQEELGACLTQHIVEPDAHRENCHQHQNQNAGQQRAEEIPLELKD